MPPRLVLLDFDGTLADSWPWLLDALAGVAARFDLARPTPVEVEALRGEDAATVLRRLGVPRWRLPAIAVHLRRLAREAPPPPLFPGVPEMLERLAVSGIVLGIASSNSAAQIRRTLGPALVARIGHVAAEASLFGKAARFRRILRKARVPPSQALAIGDELRDIAAARAVGVAAGAVAWGYAHPTRLKAERPDAFFETPGQIAAFCGA
ncbi:HAD hydrolase-like protein [Roseomonas sp. AR75]|uniref:HAD hydrolase-like protein n=1 Tax=Roseomonas sp. AR75 TaxID=2562311 RepID=UPI0010C12FE7|nr:HAD hydrolase-like protein [Roseomonas sp. AR75]